MEFEFKVTGFNNLTLEKYERKTFTYQEAVSMAKYFNIHYGCDFVVVQRISTNKYLYSID